MNKGRLSKNLATARYGNRAKKIGLAVEASKPEETRRAVKNPTLLYNYSTNEAACQAKANLKESWGDFLTTLGDKVGGWDWWVTLTFREPPAKFPNWTRVGWKYSTNAWDKFIEGLEWQKVSQKLDYGLCQGSPVIPWVRAREYQNWRGVPHFHGLVSGVWDIHRLTMKEWWYERYGIARILPYNRKLGAGFYLCKYVTKELGDIEFSQGLAKITKL